MWRVSVADPRYELTRLVHRRLALGPGFETPVHPQVLGRVTQDLGFYPLVHACSVCYRVVRWEVSPGFQEPHAITLPAGQHFGHHGLHHHAQAARHF